MISEMVSRRYRDRSLEDWFDAYLRSPCPAGSLYYEALPSFGEQFVRLAADALASLDAKKQTELIWLTTLTGRESLLTLQQLLKHPSANIRAATCRWLVNTLDEIPSEKSRAFSKFLSDYSSESTENRKQSLSHLYGDLDSELSLAKSRNAAPEEVILAVLSNLGHSDLRVRRMAFQCLEMVRIQNPALKGTVSDALQSTQLDPVEQEDMDVPWAGCNNPPPAFDAPLETLLQQVKAPLASDRVLALESIARLRVVERLSGEEILLALKDPDMAVRIAAARTLGCISCVSLNIAWSLQAALSDPCFIVAEAAESSLRCVIVKMASFLDAI
jgi:hypothetical protein